MADPQAASRVVQIDGVGNVAFPDSMSDTDVNTASAKLYSDAKAKTAPAAPEQPGAATRLMQGLLDNTVGTHTDEGVIEGFTKGLPFLAKHPIESAKLLGGAILGGHEQATGEAVNQMQQPGVGNKIAGGVRYLQSGIPIVGPMLDQAGKKFQEGDIAGGLGSTAGIAALTHGGNPEVRANAAEVAKAPVEAITKFAKAESNPNKLYAYYLGPVADNPHPVPNAPAPVMKAVLRDMEAAGDGDAAARIKSGQATIGDLDTARQSANRLAKSIYRSPGNYSPGLATGADAFASSIRDSIYPKIEEVHNMEPGSLRGVKQLQGKQMASERNPGLVDKIVTQGIGAGSGAALGHATGIPGAEYVGAAAGGRIAEPVSAGIKSGVLGLQTKRLAMGLPDPQAQPASRLPFLNQQSAPPAPAVPTFLQRAAASLPQETQMPNFLRQAAPGAPETQMPNFLSSGKVSDVKPSGEFEKWFSGSKVADAKGKPITVYHGAAEPFDKVDMSKGAQGTFWLTTDKGAIERGESGATSNKHILQANVSIKNPAGWDEYENKSIDELIRDGYDGVILPEGDHSNIIAFHPEQVRFKGAKGKSK